MNLSESQQWVVMVFEWRASPLGLLAAEPLDMVETRAGHRHGHAAAAGRRRSAVLNGRTTLMLDIFELADGAPAMAGREPAAAAAPSPPRQSATVLVAEDSDFFRGQIKRLIEAVGCRVLAAEDGRPPGNPGPPRR